MPTDPTDTPDSLRALATHLLSFGVCHPRDTEYNSVPDAVEALRRAADRLEVSASVRRAMAGGLIGMADTDAIAAARRAGAEEMRAAAAEACVCRGAAFHVSVANGMLPDDYRTGYDEALDHAFDAILALPLPGDTP